MRVAPAQVVGDLSKEDHRLKLVGDVFGGLRSDADKEKPSLISRFRQA